MKRLVKGLAIIALSSAVLQALPAMAQTETLKNRSISVSGEAKANVAPDQAVISMSLVSKDKNLAEAKKQNDAMTERLVTITKNYNIPREKVATSNIYIAPEYVFNPKDNQQHFNTYTVNRSIRIVVDKLEVQEPLLSAIVDAKIDQVNGVDFQIADPEKTISGLRVKAFANAKGKAEALAQAAGSKLGQAMMINTSEVSMPVPPRPMMAMMAKAEMADSGSVAPSLPGLIPLEASVNVTFAME